MASGGFPATSSNRVQPPRHKGTKYIRKEIIASVWYEPRKVIRFYAPVTEKSVKRTWPVFSS